MLSKKEYIQSASVLIDQKGDKEALEFIQQRLRDMEAKGDTQGYQAWYAVLGAYGQLVRTKPVEGETVQ